MSLENWSLQKWALWNGSLPNWVLKERNSWKCTFAKLLLFQNDSLQKLFLRKCAFKSAPCKMDLCLNPTQVNMYFLWQHFLSLLFTYQSNYHIHVLFMWISLCKICVCVIIVYYSIGFTISTSKFWRQINKSGGGGCLLIGRAKF